MKTSWIRKNDAERLVLFFGGFASDEKLMSASAPADFDILMFYDYGTLDCEIPQEVFSYARVSVVAWSFGVWVADFMRARLPKADMRIALCGSPYPVDDSRGIPESVFNGTVENFSEAGKEKFLARVFGANLEASKKFFADRNADEEKSELENLSAAFKKFQGNPDAWTRAIAARDDKIFALKNLKSAWGGKLETISGGHFPAEIFKESFANLLSPAPIVGKAFSRSLSSYENSAEVQKKIAERLAQLVLKRVDVSRIREILEIGAGTGFLTRALAKKLVGKNWHLNDISADVGAFLKDIPDTSPSLIVGDAQIQEFPQNMDLIVSASCFQWIANLPLFLKKLAASSHDGTVLAFSTFLPANLREIRGLTGRGIDYVGTVGLESMIINAGFELLCSESETYNLEFDTPTDVLRHLRATGVCGAFSEFWTPQKLKSFTKNYIEYYSTPQKTVTLTYKPIYFVAKFVGVKKEAGEL